MIYDSHAHLISADQKTYPPRPLRGELTPGEFDDPMTAEKLLGLMDANGVARACAVQRAHVYGYHNDYILDAAARYPDRFAAVVVLNAVDPQTPATLRRLCAERNAVGVRFTAPSFPTSPLNWLDSAEARLSWRAAAELGLPVCIHVLHVQRETVLPALKAAARQFADTPVVVDHVGGAHAAVVELKWMAAQGMPVQEAVHPVAWELADLPNVVMKLSTINLERLEQVGVGLSPFVDAVVRRFGAQRVLWGSDIGQSRGDYAHMVELLHEGVASLCESDQQQVLFGTAARLYGPP